MRLRLTALYGVLFLVSGAVLLAITGGVVYSAVQRAGGPRPGRPRSPRWRRRTPASSSSRSSWPPSSRRSTRHVARPADRVGDRARHHDPGGGALGWVVAGRALRPLRQITAATRRISDDNLHERLAVTGPDDELKELADTIDGLLARLEGAFAAQRRFVANASHELRTPLTTMRASLDVAVAKPEPVPPQTITLAGRLRAELDQVDRLLDGLLALARAQHGALPGHRPSRSTPSSPRRWPPGPTRSRPGT